MYRIRSDTSIETAASLDVFQVRSHIFGINLILIFFVAGAIGNLIDRIVNNYVVDFFYFKLINFPIFNVADIYVTVAAFAFIILGIFYYKEEDFEMIFKKKDKK